MAFLVKTDNHERYAIPNGETTIGRGPYLRVKELSLSRSHALLSFDNGKLSIKSTHKNPTFYNSSDSLKDDQKEILEKDQWKELSNGDVISLLADSYEYSVEIMENKLTSDDEKVRNGKENEKQTFVKLINECEPTSTDKQENSEVSCRNDEKLSSIENKKSPKKRTLPPWMSGTGVSPQKKKINKEENSSPTKGNASPQLVSSGSLESCNPEGFELETRLDAGLNTQSANNNSSLNELTPQNSSLQNDLDEYSTSSAAQDKASHSAMSDLTIHPTNYRDDDEEEVQQKENPGEEDSTQNDDNSEVVLKQCPYGKKCYRKNPLHFQEYSHTSKDDNNSDQDVEKNSDGTKSECPYGMKCYRQYNPFHTNKYTHNSIGRERTARRTRKAKKKKGKSLLDNASDAEGENEYDMNDSFLASSDDSGGYSDDPDDSDYAPFSDKEEEEEDLNELVSEANGFIKNKKM